MNINEKRQALMPVIAKALWNSAAEEEEGRRESSGFGVDDSVRYWDDLEDFERRSLTNQQSTVAIGIARAGWRPPARAIESVEELEALPDDAVILDRNDNVWVAKANGVPSEMLGTLLPATVLFEGGAS